MTHTYIIAEIGSNHDGKFSRAVELIQESAAAGVDAVKFQLFRADMLAKRRHLNSENEATLKANELPIDWLQALADTAKSFGVDFLCTAYDIFDLAAVSPYVKYFKVASFEASDMEFLRAHLHYPQQVIVSTGMMEYLDVLAISTNLGHDKMRALLHCVSAYPAPPESLNLSSITYLKQHLPGVPIGFSDHAEGIIPSLAAVAVGAEVIEKHVTGVPRGHGPDSGPHAINTVELRHMVQSIRLIETTIGDIGKFPQPAEAQMIQHRVRRS